MVGAWDPVASVQSCATGNSTDTALVRRVCASVESNDYPYAVSHFLLTHGRLTCNEQALTFCP